MKGCSNKTKEKLIHLNVKKKSVSAFLFSFLLLFGCGGKNGFQIEDLAKTDINIVFEIHIEQTTETLKKLTRKLYKRNPAELAKAQGISVEDRINQIFTCPVQHTYQSLEFKEGTDAILLGFEPDYTGDRVFAIMYGLYTMMHKSYNRKCELYLLDYLNEQNLYNSARNIEVLVWRLKTRKNSDGKLLILTNSLETEVKNLSFERIFGKLISLQDTMATIVSTRTGRLITESLHTVGMAFFPIGI